MQSVPIAELNLKRLIRNQLYSISHWLLIGFHCGDQNGKKDELLQDVAVLKRKPHRIIYKSRGRSVKDAGKYLYPRILSFHEGSNQGAAQFHVHLIVK